MKWWNNQSTRTPYSESDSTTLTTTTVFRSEKCGEGIIEYRSTTSALKGQFWVEFNIPSELEEPVSDWVKPTVDGCITCSITMQIFNACEGDLKKEQAFTLPLKLSCEEGRGDTEAATNKTPGVPVECSGTSIRAMMSQASTQNHNLLLKNVPIVY